MSTIKYRVRDYSPKTETQGGTGTIDIGGGASPDPSEGGGKIKKSEK